MKEKKILNKYSLTILFIILLIVIDQVTKALALKYIQSFGTGTVSINSILNFTYVKNTGGAFGLGSDSTITYIITNIIVIGIIIRFLILQSELIDKKTNVILSIILAGGFSNLIDRILRGFVVDFIDISPLINFPKFNLADIYITTGWIIFVAIMASYTFKEVIKKNKKHVNKEG